MDVDPQLLERLMLDKALGQLSEDAEALLAAVVAEDATRRSHQSQLIQAAALAREALKRRGASPPLELPPLATPLRRRQRRPAALMPLALAGCLLLGLCAGRLLPRGRPSPGPESPLVVAPAPVPAERPSGLWSVQGFIDRAKANRGRPKPLIEWRSLSQMHL